MDVNTATGNVSLRAVADSPRPPPAPDLAPLVFLASRWGDLTPPERLAVCVALKEVGDVMRWLGRLEEMLRAEGRFP